MVTKVCVIGILLLLPLVVVAQTSEQPIKSEAELASALCHVQKDEQSRAGLLSDYPQLIDSRLWEDVSRRAADAYYQESPDRALKIYEVLIQVANKLGDTKLLAKTYYNLARTFSGVNQTDSAIQSYEKSREYFSQAGLKRDLIYVLADIGAIYFNKEDYQKAKEYSEQSIQISESARISDVPVGSYPDDFGRARALHTLAEMDLRNGHQEDAIEKLQRALGLYQGLNGQGSNYNFYVGGVYATLGKVYPETGDYTRALFYLNKALDLAKVSYDQDTLANILNSIGFLYMEQEDYAQAKEHFGRSLKIYLAENNRVEASKLLLNLGVIEQREGHYAEALAQFELSLQAAKATQLADVQIAAGEGIGVVLTAKRDFAAALGILDKCIDLSKDTKNRIRHTELLWRSGQVRYEMGDYARSAELAQEALTLARAAHLPKLMYLSTTTLGQTYAAQNKIELATQTLMDAVAQSDAMRYQVAGREVERQLFFENKVSSYKLLIDLLLKQGKVVDAFLYSERAKGRVLLDVLDSGKLDLAKTLSVTEKKESERLNRRISETNDLIRAQEGKGDSPGTTVLYTQLDAARLDYRSFEDAIYASHPELRARSGRTSVLTAADMSNLSLDRDCAYLEYVVSKDDVLLFVLTIDSAGVSNLQSYSLEIKPNELAAKVNQFHDRLANRHPDYAPGSQELYSLLVKPASAQIVDKETICVIPDGVLWNLPFQALMNSRDHYLLQDHALYYAPSVSVLREMAKERVDKQRQGSSLIAFGNPVIGTDAQRNEELCPLPEAATEVTTIARTVDSTGSKVFIGREASEKTFRALAPNYLTIHLATHGVIDNRQPLYSHLLLTKTEGDLENDGLLEAREIMNMNLHADLAVLSACETANGTISPGEGVMGMSWAFFVAGTRSMFVSQWKVNSASTSRLMVDFYQAQSFKTARHDGNAAALRDADLRMMKNQQFRHPFYWAGFVLIGVN